MVTRAHKECDLTGSKVTWKTIQRKEHVVPAGEYRSLRYYGKKKE